MSTFMISFVEVVNCATKVAVFCFSLIWSLPKKSSRLLRESWNRVQMKIADRLRRLLCCISIPITSDVTVRRKTISQATRQRIACAQGYKCPICKEQLSDAWDVDHKKRLADNGSNEESNLQVLCTRCHRTKTAIENSTDKKGTLLRQQRITIARLQGYKCAGCGETLGHVWIQSGEKVFCESCRSSIGNDKRKQFEDKLKRCTTISRGSHPKIEKIVARRPHLLLLFDRKIEDTIGKCQYYKTFEDTRNRRKSPFTESSSWYEYKRGYIDFR